MKDLKYYLVLLLILPAIVWAFSLTNEYVGYDDIEIIANNSKIQAGIIDAFKQNISQVTESYNLAWGDQATAIYRPLERILLSLGYSIWGNQPFYYHLCFNYLFYLLNTILVFLILLRLFQPLTLVPADFSSVTRSSSASAAKQSSNNGKTIQSGGVDIASLLAFITTLLWSVHPLHNEAINMLTSGPGFLFGTMMILLALCINLYYESLALTIVAALLYLLGFLSAEMHLALVIVLPLLLWLNGDNFRIALKKFAAAIIAALTFISFKFSVVGALSSLDAMSFAEFWQRKYILAPQILLHYCKLFFLPLTLTHDQQHQVLLTEAGSSWHLLSLLVSLVMGLSALLLLYFKRKSVLARTIGVFSLFAITSLALALNVIPIYTLARERYTYFFVLGFIVCLVLVMYLLFSKLFVEQDLISTKREVQSLALLLKTNRPLLLIAITALILAGCYSYRSITRSLDWQNGEKFWLSEIKNTSDLGARLIWKYRLLSYYRDPGTASFKAQMSSSDKVLSELFTELESATLKNTIQEYINSAPQETLKNKYGYADNKSLASALFYISRLYLEQGQINKGIELLNYAKQLHPQHFYVNNLMLNLSEDKELQYKLVREIFPLAASSPFWSVEFINTLFNIAYDEPTIYTITEELLTQYPNYIGLLHHYFVASYRIGKYAQSYKIASALKKRGYKNSELEWLLADYQQNPAKYQIPAPTIEN